MNPQRTGAVILALAVLPAVGVRWYGLEQVGVGGSDTILYFALAEAWSRGDLVFAIGDSGEVFRPVLLAFNALALTTFGHQDYAIKLANCLVDVLNMLLVAVLAWQVAGRRTVAVASALTYGLLPIAIWAARQELPHTLSTALVTLACLLACRAVLAPYGPRATGLLGCSGLALMAATLVHEELVIVALPLALAVLLRVWACGTGSARRLGTALVALLCFPLAAALLVFAHEGERVLAVTRPAADTLSHALFPYPERATRFLWNGVVGASSSLFAIAYALSAICYLWVLHRRRGEDDRYLVGGGICVGVPLVFVAVYALFFGTVFPRGVLPLMPLAIVAVFSSVDRCLGARGAGPRAVISIALVLVFAVSSLASYTAFKVGNRRFGKAWAAPDWPSAALLQRGYREFLVDARYVPSYATHWRRVYDALGDRVDRDHRLLVTPSTVFYAAGRRALQTGVYFGDNAIYRLDHFDEPLAALIRDRKVGFVLFTLGQSRGVPSRHRPYLYGGEWGDPREVDLASAYGLREYSPQGEYRQLALALRAMGARPLALFTPGSYEARVARVWQLP